MVALRTRPKGGVVAPFGLCTFAIALLPAPIGDQDLTALFSFQAGAASAPPSSVRAARSGTVYPAPYSFPQPPGTGIPRPAGYRLASLDPRMILGAIGGGPREADAQPPPVEFPKVDRTRKGDALALPERSPAPEPMPSPTARAREAHAALAPYVEQGQVAEGALPPKELNADAPPEDGVWPPLGAAEFSASDNPTMDTALLYFGAGSLDAPPSLLDRPEEDKVVAIPLPEARPVTGDPAAPPGANPGVTKAEPTVGGQTIVGKGELPRVRPRAASPAERLKLTVPARAKAEKCLAEAVYFEARGESVRGQIGVAQVVMNRVFSEFYPDNVCDVVYQNAHRHLACQFTFACDGIRDVVNDAEAWRRAKRIAKDTLDGNLWLDDVGKATHYHAYWVRPWWIGTMRKLHKIGVHTFYRPRRWGDGSDEPVWGDAAATAKAAETL